MGNALTKAGGKTSIWLVRKELDGSVVRIRPISISIRAWGLYEYIKIRGYIESAVTISKSFNEGEEATLTALNELRALGLIETRKDYDNGRIKTKSRFTGLDLEIVKRYYPT